MRVIFFSKTSKFDVDLRNAAKEWQNIFRLIGNCIWIGYNNSSLWRREYFSSAVIALTKCPKISGINKTDIFELNFPLGDGEVW